jgi:Putative Flp pilus-assembly TadE/G-like
MGKFARGSDRQGGQTLIIFTIAMPLFLAIAALVVDGSTLLVHRRSLQVAADASALAVAQSLKTPCATSAPSCLPELASDYSQKNGGPAGQPCNQVDPLGDPTKKCLPPCNDDSSKPNCFQTPYNDHKPATDDTTLVEVRLTKSATGLFTGAVGLKNLFGVSARAVASGSPQLFITPGSTTTIVTGGTASTVITPGSTSVSTSTIGSGGQGGGVAFAKSTACGNGTAAIQYTGSGGGYIGALETNGGIFTNGNSNKTIDYLSLGRYGQGSGQQSCFLNSAPATINHPITGPFAPKPWPIDPPPIPTPPSCTALVPDPVTNIYSISSSWAGPAHPPGVYCLTGTTGTLALANADLTGGAGYTFFAPYISVSGGSYKCYQYCDPIPSGFPAPGQIPTLFYAFGTDPTKGITVQGGGATLTGYLFAPSGEIAFQGNGATGGKGFIEAQTLKFAGTFVSYQGIGPTGITYTTTTSTTTGPNSTTVIVTPGTTNTVTNPAQTATTGTTIALNQ